MSIILRVALVVAAVVAVGIMLFKSIGSSPSSGPSAAAPRADQTIVVPTLVLPTQLANALGQPAVAPPPPGTEWNPVLEVSGTDSERSQTFDLSGNTFRLRYNVQVSEGNQAALLAVYVVPSTQTTTSGFPDALVLAGGDGEKLLTRPAGTYALSVQALGCAWTLDVEEAM